MFMFAMMRMFYVLLGCGLITLVGFEETIGWMCSQIDLKEERNTKPNKIRMHSRWKPVCNCERESAVPFDSDRIKFSPSRRAFHLLRFVSMCLWVFPKSFPALTHSRASVFYDFHNTSYLVCPRFHLQKLSERFYVLMRRLLFSCDAIAAV